MKVDAGIPVSTFLFILIEKVMNHIFYKDDSIRFPNFLIYNHEPIKNNHLTRENHFGG